MVETGTRRKPPFSESRVAMKSLVLTMQWILWSLLFFQPTEASYEYKLMGTGSMCEPSFPSITSLPFSVTLDVRMDTVDDFASRQQTIFDMGDKEGWSTFFFLGQNLLKESNPMVPLFHAQANGLPQETFGSNPYSMGNRLTMTNESYTVGSNAGMMKLSFGVEADGTMWLKDKKSNEMLGTMVMDTLPTISSSMVIDFAKSLSPTRSLVFGPLQGAISGIEISAPTASMTERLLYKNYVGQPFSEPFAVSFYARFQDLTYDTNQAVFDFGNGSTDNVYCRQDASSDRMVCGVKVDSTPYEVATPYASIEEGAWAYWQFQVNVNGVYGIFKDGAKLAETTHAGVLPNHVFRKDMHIARSSLLASDGRMQGVVAGFRVNRLVLFGSTSVTDAVTPSNGCGVCTSSYVCPPGYEPTNSCPGDGNDCAAICSNNGFTCPNTYIPINSCPQSFSDCICYRSNCGTGHLTVSVIGLPGTYDGNVIAQVINRDGTTTETVLFYNFRSHLGGTYTLDLQEGDSVRLGIHISFWKTWSNNRFAAKTMSPIANGSVDLGFEDDGGTDMEDVQLRATISHNAVLMIPTDVVATGVTNELLSNPYFATQNWSGWSALNPTGGRSAQYYLRAQGIALNGMDEDAGGDGIEQTVTTVPYATLMAFVELKTFGTGSATHDAKIEIIDADTSTVLADVTVSISTGNRDTFTLSAPAASANTTIRVTNPTSTNTVASDLIIVHVSLTGIAP